MILLHSQINFNMGCIETIIVCKLYICLFGLTLTWDVLKQKSFAYPAIKLED